MRSPESRRGERSPGGSRPGGARRPAGPHVGLSHGKALRADASMVGGPEHVSRQMPRADERRFTLRTFKYKLSYNLGHNQKKTQKDTQPWGTLDARRAPSGRLALHAAPGPVLVLLVGLAVLAPALVAGAELLQLHLLHVVRDRHLLPRREQGLELGQLVQRQPELLREDDLDGRETVEWGGRLPPGSATAVAQGTGRRALTRNWMTRLPRSRGAL